MSRSSKQKYIANNLNLSTKGSATQCSSKPIHAAEQVSVSDMVFLYKLVYKSRNAALLSVFLCLCFLIQPLERVQASEDISAESVVVPEVVLETEIETQSIAESDVTTDEFDSERENNQDGVETVDEVLQDTEELIDVDSTVLTQDLEPDVVESQATTSDEYASTTGEQVTTGVSDESTSSSNTVSATSSDQNASSSTATSSVVSDAQDSAPVADTNNSDADLIIATSSVDQSTATEPELDEGSFISIVESDSHFAFSKDECTRIDDGSYYCTESTGVIELDDSLIAAPDVDGDLEIFLIRKGERYQITSNKVDDASPYYDEYSGTIVWHRLTQDRYQIISYDVDSGEETQITQTNVNNMEPARHGEYTVWQRWVEDNWEVILYDGVTEKQITDSARHDIAPHVRGPLVIWNSQSNDGTQALRTYDINDRTYTTIADGEGVSVTNPRMIVMYEALYENGDIVTKGFDLLSGEIVPLHSLPRELPDELPESESTGEVRALIQTKPETRESEVDDSQGGPEPVATPPPTVADDTLDLSAIATTTQERVVISDEELLKNEIPDIVVPLTGATTSTSTSTQPE